MPQKSLDVAKSPTHPNREPESSVAMVLDDAVVTEPVVTEPVVTEPVVTEPVVTEPVVTEPEKQQATIPSAPAPIAMKPATPPPPSTYFAQPGQQASRKGFWRGSPAEIVFSTVMGVAIIIAFVLALVRIPAPASATTGDTSGGMNHGTATSATGNSNTPSINVPAHEVYPAAAPAAPAGSVVNVTLNVEDKLISIAPGIAYKAWTFNGTVPGPIIRVRQGQTVHFTLVNKSPMAHSIDFHAAETPWNVNYQAVEAGKSFSFDWKANYPGVFMYHCGTPPVIQHIANGMYGAIIVDPAKGWSPAREYVLVQSEFYTMKLSDGSYSFDYNKSMAMQPDYVTFNGYANQYKDKPLTGQAGHKVRLFIMNAGPSEFSAFHVIGAILTDAYADGNPANHTVGQQTVTIPPGGGAVVELTIPEAGQYPFVTHSFANASSGALGVLDIKP